MSRKSFEHVSGVSGTADAKKRQKGRIKAEVAEQYKTAAYLLASSSLDNDDRCMNGLLIWCRLVGSNPCLAHLGK